MILVLALALGLLLRVLAGRNWRDVGQLRIRGERLMLFTLAVVVALPAGAGLSGWLRMLVIPFWLSAMAVLSVLCALNAESSPGFVVLGAGIASNLLAIATNGVMPVSEAAARVAGGATAVAVVRAGNTFHAVAGTQTRLLLLGDVLPLPFIPGIRSILSVGDVLMLAGIGIVLVAHQRHQQPLEPAFARSAFKKREDSPPRMPK